MVWNSGFLGTAFAFVNFVPFGFFLRKAGTPHFSPLVPIRAFGPSVLFFGYALWYQYYFSGWGDYFHQAGSSLVFTVLLTFTTVKYRRNNHVCFNRKYALLPVSALCRYVQGMTGLYQLIKSDMSLSPVSGDVFVSFPTNGTWLKILRWDTDGFILYQKRLEEGTFEVPRFNPSTGAYELSRKSFF